MNKLSFMIIAGALTIISMVSCDTRESSKKVTQKTLDMVDGISDALKEQGEESGENITDGLGEVGKGVGKSLGKLLDENIDTIGKVAGTVIARGGTAIIEGVQNALYPAVDFENAAENAIQISSLGISKVDNHIGVFTEKCITEDNEILITSYDSHNKKILVLKGSFPYSSQLCEIAVTTEELKLFKSADRRVVTIRLIKKY